MDGLVYINLRTASALVESLGTKTARPTELGLVTSQSRNLNLLKRYHSIRNDGGMRTSKHHAYEMAGHSRPF